MHTMQKQGKWVGGKTPLGYIKDSKDKNKLIIYEPEAKIVRTIFNMASNGKQVGTIRDYLNGAISLLPFDASKVSIPSVTETYLILFSGNHFSIYSPVSI